MFLGQHISKIRANRHLAIPPILREELGEFIYLTRGFESLLLVFPEQTFLRLCAQFATTSLTDPLARLFGRFFLGHASRVKVGPRGNVSIPQDLLELHEAEQDVILVGQGQYLELWSVENWKKHLITLGTNIQGEFEKFQIMLT